MGLAWRAQGARRRRRWVTSSTTSNAAITVQSPCTLRVRGGAGASAALALLDDVPASLASRRPASAPAAPSATPPNSQRGS